MLDKGVDMFQERVLHQGPQNNESAMEQAKDEQISDGIRKAYKSGTGSDFPVADKWPHRPVVNPKRYGSSSKPT